MQVTVFFLSLELEASSEEKSRKNRDVTEQVI